MQPAEQKAGYFKYTLDKIIDPNFGRLRYSLMRSRSDIRRTLKCLHNTVHDSLFPAEYAVAHRLGGEMFYENSNSNRRNI